MKNYCKQVVDLSDIFIGGCGAPVGYKDKFAKYLKQIEDREVKVNVINPNA